MKKIFLLIALAFAFCPSCDLFGTKDDATDALKGEHNYAGGSLKMTVSSTSETVGDATITINFDSGSFFLFAFGEKNDVEIDMASGYTGTGVYDFKVVKPTTAEGGDKNLNYYAWNAAETGSLTIEENTADAIKGSYKFYGAEIVSGVRKQLSGSFTIPKK